MELGYGLDDFLEFKRAVVRDKFATNRAVFVCVSVSVKPASICDQRSDKQRSNAKFVSVMYVEAVLIISLTRLPPL